MFQLPMLGWVHFSHKYGIKRKHAGYTRARYSAGLHTVFCLRTSRISLLLYGKARQLAVLKGLYFMNVLFIFLNIMFSQVLRLPFTTMMKNNGF